MIVLVVEDDAIVGLYMREVLSCAGFVVIGPVSNASEAIGRCDHERPDLALIDIGLAGERDGMWLAAELNKKGNIPSLFVTGRRSREIEHTENALGAVEKPFSASVLLQSVDLAREIISGQTLTSSQLPKGFALFMQPRGGADAGNNAKI